MFENDEQFIENKLLILFTLREFDMPITGLYMDEIMLKPGLMNYFSMQQALSELIAINAVSCEPDSCGIQMYGITAKGIDILDSLEYTIKKGIAATYEKCIKANKESIVKEMDIGATVFTDSDEKYFVRCYIRSGRAYPVDIKIPVPSKDDGYLIASNWKSNASKTFLKVINAMTPEQSSAE